MEINIKNIKNSNSNISFDDILLSGNNPRFTLIESIEQNLINSLVVGNERFDNELQIFKELLESEGDFSDLNRLLENILDFGFNNSAEPIYLVYNKKYKKYIIAEGNRRVMCLKLILGKFILPKFEDLSNIFSYSNNINEIISKNEYEESNEKDVEKTKNNYEYSKKLIDKIKNKYLNQSWYLEIEIIDDPDKLWKTIYDKHLTGVRPGMRQWSRTKYFADLLNIFKDGIVLDGGKNIKLKSIFEKIRREPKMVQKDFEEAQYIYALIYFYRSYNNEKEYVENYNIKEILEEMTHLSRPSALERTHSFNKLKKLFCVNSINIDEKKFDQKYIRIEFEKYDRRLKIIYNEIKPSVLFPFIVRKWKDKEITTRPFKDENKMFQDLQKEVIDNLDFLNRMSLEEIKKIDEFAIPLESLNSLIEANEPFHKKSDIEYLKKTKNVRETTLKIIEDISKKIDEDNDVFVQDSPKYIFTILFNQLKWNFSEKNKFKFLNAAATSIRSFFEQLILWTYINIQDLEISSLLINEMCKGKIYLLFRAIRNKKQIKPYTFSNKEKRDLEPLSDLTISKMIKKVIYDVNETPSLVKQIDQIINEITYEILNEPIHASHRIYFTNEYNDYLKLIQESISIINNIINKIDFSKLNWLNNEIIKTLSNK